LCEAARRKLGTSVLGEKAVATWERLATDQASTSAVHESAAASPVSAQQEVASYFRLLAAAAMLSSSDDEGAAVVCEELIADLTEADQRSCDAFLAKAWAMLALVKERHGLSAELRPRLVAAHRTASLRHDDFGQAVTLNLLLRVLTNAREYDQASKLLENAAFPDVVSNNQLVRYLYYSGKIAAVQLDYTDASRSLTQALRKAPTGTALGFRQAAQKLLVVVQLLMGEIPERSVFRQEGFEHALLPYFHVVAAVRVGDMGAFERALAEHEATFRLDDTWLLLGRVRMTVIKAGLRRVVTSYSRISFQDIADKLHLDSAQDAEFLAAKAVRDGVIDARLNHEDGTLHSQESGDVYSTSEPRVAFDRRIRFCLDVRNEAVKAMQYPDADKKKKSEEEEKLPDIEDDAALADEIADAMDEDDE
jgi:26S proteasome regulatory subunit N3